MALLPGFFSYPALYPLVTCCVFMCRNMVQIFQTRALSQELIVCKTLIGRGERYQQWADVHTLISD